jgi:hypothetical protein
MIHINKTLVLLLIVPIISIIVARETFGQKEDLSQVWPAKWIAASNGPWKEYAVHRFRKSFNLEEISGTLIIHTSGDNRYRLFVNGEFVTWGPQLGDLDHWYYESTDISPFLKPGTNTIAAEVLNYGSHPPDAKQSVQTGFLLCADDREYRFLNTSKTWKAIHDPSYSPNIVDGSQVRGYYGGGLREIIDDGKYLWDWNLTNFNDSTWTHATEIETAFSRTCKWASRWKLTSRTLPHESLISQEFESIRDFSGVPGTETFLKQDSKLVIPPDTTVRLIFDQGFETTAYPVISYAGGQGSTITVRYSEAPVIGDISSRKRGNRNEIEGKNFYGYFDRVLVGNNPDRVPFESFSTNISKSGNKTYIPFWWRSFRYIELVVETQETPLEIQSFYSIASSYPFETQANFQTRSSEASKYDKILEIGERTIRCCAHESFMDCPYYEESQFEGDTRVQALVSYANFGDPSLGKNAIGQFAWSLNSEGFLSARYPTNSTYYIPNYSLYWIGMLHDYMMQFDDPEFIRLNLPVTRLIMSYFTERLRQDGTVRKPDYHNFVDWSFPAGEPPFNENGYSALVDLHFLMALQWAEELEQQYGDIRIANDYLMKANNIVSTIKDIYYQPYEKLFSDTPEGNDYSVHTNVLAILTGVLKNNEATELMWQVLNDSTLKQPTIYFRFYLFEALKKAGLGNYYLENLGIWEEMMSAGVTTWPETGLESRSECHAWGASPNYHFYKIVAGIEPAEPGFKSVKIDPCLGNLTDIRVSYPHQEGIIEIELENHKGKTEGKIFLPGKLNGSFAAGNYEMLLKPGWNYIK